MKKILTILCLISAGYAVYFPFSYFSKDNDKMEVKVSHILVNTEEEAQKIKKEIQDGRDFHSAAYEYSQCSSKNQNGEIGYVQRGRYNKDFENAVFSMPANRLSEPVHTPDGWQAGKTSGW